MRQRCGVSLIEFIIAASLLVTIMTVSGQLINSSKHVWSRTRHERLAMEELTNQMEILLATPRESLEQAILNPRPSDWIQLSLSNPQIEAEKIDDEFGKRIRLTLQWTPSPGDITYRELHAWLDTPTEINTTPAENDE